MQAALPAVQAELPLHDQPSVPEPEPALPFRSDTILGVCEALGQDFGFNPTYLRVVLASLVLWNSFAAIGIYLALGVGVALSRWIYPAPRPAPASEPVSQTAAPGAANQPESLSLAA
jgi:phage shock protein PspC (stress-responsive transcriptional regulator)